VYGLKDGLIKDLSVIHDGQEDIDSIYRFNIIGTKTIDLVKAPAEPVVKLHLKKALVTHKAERIKSKG
ncbi:MAG: hypothetical protein ABIS01_12360, partial [Ferruginibacter sp.]